MCFLRTFWYVSELSTSIRSRDTVSEELKNGRGQKGRGTEKCPTGENFYPGKYCCLRSIESIYVEKSRVCSNVSGIIIRYRIISNFKLLSCDWIFDPWSWPALLMIVVFVWDTTVDVARKLSSLSLSITLIMAGVDPSLVSRFSYPDNNMILVRHSIVFANNY